MDAYDRIASRNTYGKELASQNPRDDYASKLLNYNEIGTEPEASRSPASSDEGGFKADSVGGMNTAAQGAQSGELGQMLMGGGMMSGNPWIAAAGLGVSAIEQGQRAKVNEENARRSFYNDLIQKRMNIAEGNLQSQRASRIFR